MDKAIYSKQEVNRIVASYAQALRARAVRHEGIYLFGSYARGTPRPWSDIDVAVVSDDFGTNPVADGVRLDEIADEISVALEPHAVGAADFSRGLAPIAVEVKRHGIRIRA